ncbi:hypothetical protein Peur_027102 [Populus x canadensis]
MLQNIALLFLTNRYRQATNEVASSSTIHASINLKSQKSWKGTSMPDNVFLLDPCWIFEQSLCHTLGGAQKGIVWQ